MHVGGAGYRHANRCYNTGRKQTRIADSRFRTPPTTFTNQRQKPNTAEQYWTEQEPNRIEHPKMLVPRKHATGERTHVLSSSDHKTVAIPEEHGRGEKTEPSERDGVSLNSLNSLSLTSIRTLSLTITTTDQTVSQQLSSEHRETVGEEDSVGDQI